MSDLPLRSISIADFRSLEGHRVLPLDAPIVLLHGPNGTGKTSVLSALELALTGDIRSMRRQDPRFTAYLPFHGQDFATLRVDVSDQLVANPHPATMTVGGNRIDGAPALSEEAAQFYAERCYLDQVSLGQLLELYQFREGKEESALARFVNELLGLEQLDALREGLSDATDLRLLRKLSEPLAEAERTAKQANEELAIATKALEEARDLLGRLRQDVAPTLASLGEPVPASVDDGVTLLHTALGVHAGIEADISSTQELVNELTALGGQIEGLVNRPSVLRLEERRVALAAVATELERWGVEHQAKIDRWRVAVESAGFGSSRDDQEALESELARTERTTAHQEELTTARGRLNDQIQKQRAVLADAQARLAEVQSIAGVEVEALSALRQRTDTNVCPVCDRDFSEVSPVHLTSHVDQKIEELTHLGAQLIDLRTARDASEAAIRRDESTLKEVEAGLLTKEQVADGLSRRTTLLQLREEFVQIQPAIQDGRRLENQMRDIEREVEEFEATAAEMASVETEIVRIATRLEVAVSGAGQSLQESWRELLDSATGKLTGFETLRDAAYLARELLSHITSVEGGVAGLTENVTRAAEQKVGSEAVVSEAKRRQGVATAVRNAASSARAAVVQRVFTQSLNDVWRDVFTRLAPREPFVPTFGIPTSSKTALELTLETVHRSVGTGGAPQMMLSAGNLNTAALSLFIALHLAVEPLVPCLVFDDPVQSMDEVHIAQFAGLVRVLSKHHGRQVVIAVHDRELFEYLALELSPAFDGDELLTIELGDRSEDEDQGVTRVAWSADEAIAI